MQVSRGLVAKTTRTLSNDLQPNLNRRNRISPTDICSCHKSFKFNGATFAKGGFPCPVKMSCTEEVRNLVCMSECGVFQLRRRLTSFAVSSLGSATDVSRQRDCRLPSMFPSPGACSWLSVLSFAEKVWVACSLLLLRTLYVTSAAMMVKELKIADTAIPTISPTLRLL